MSDDLHDERAVEERNKRLKMKERDRLGALGGIVSEPGGRAWIHNLLSITHVFDSSFSNNSHAMAFREGERQVGLRILADMMAAAPEQWVPMMTEAQK